MIKIKLKFLIEDVDRHGKVRLYVRLPGHQKIRIREIPGTSEFMTAYQNAITGIDFKNRRTKYKSPAQGSFGYVCLAYYASGIFKALDVSTQKWRRRSLDEICKHHGDSRIEEMTSYHVRKLRDQKRGKPGAARNCLKALKALFAWAVEYKLVSHDPTQGVKPVEYSARPLHTWTNDEINKFKERFPIGTKPYDALTILLYTAGRREDAVRLGPSNIQNNRVVFYQAKNEHRNPVKVDIPVHPDLGEIIRRTPADNETFLMTEYGKPFSPNGFGNKFRKWCNQAGLPQCSTHGLRKAIATFLAEGGASAHEIMSVTGHQTLEEVERYTRDAQRQLLANSAMQKLRR